MSQTIRIDYPNGNYVEYEYDSEGRVTKQTRPWGDGGKKMTRNVYAANSTRFYDTRPIKVYTDYEDANGTFLNLAVTDYTYEENKAYADSYRKDLEAGEESDNGYHEFLQGMADREIISLYENYGIVTNIKIEGWEPTKNEH